MKIPRLLLPALALAALALAGWHFSAQAGQPPASPAPAQYRRLSPEQLDSLWRETVRQSGEPVLI